MHKSNLFLVSAPSGTGKSTLINSVLDKAVQFNFPLELSISYTTRIPRVGETDTNHYFFVSPEEFIAKKEANFFLHFSFIGNISELELHVTMHCWKAILKSKETVC